MCKFIAIPLSLCCIFFAFTDCTSRFDQRQTGDLNVQIGLKNIQLIALLNGRNEEYVDYDYAYDYSEMTIKPQNGTTPKPLNVTNTQMQSNSTMPTSVINTTEPINIELSIMHPLNTTELSNNETESRINATEGSSGNFMNQTVNEMLVQASPVQVKVDVPTTQSSDSDLNDVSAAPTVSPTHCRRGFVQNHQGKCEYKVHGTSNALRRIVKLAQKIKIGRGYKET